jgi:hypothetical protein
MRRLSPRRLPTADSDRCRVLIGVRLCAVQRDFCKIWPEFLNLEAAPPLP